MKKKSLISILTTAIAGVALLGSVTVQAAAVTDIDFEDPTYSTGALEGQDYWTRSGTGTVEVVDSPQHFSSVYEGSQMVEFVQTSDSSQGATRGFGANAEASFSDTFTFSFAFAYNLESGGDLGNMPRIDLQSADSADRVTFGFRVGEKFGWYDGGSLQGTANGSTSPDTFYVFSGEARPSDGTYDFTITNTSDNSTPVDETNLDFQDWSGADTSVFEQISISNIGDQARLAVDDISVVPEPGTFALLALAGLLLMKRRGCSCKQ